MNLLAPFSVPLFCSCWQLLFSLIFSLLFKIVCWNLFLCTILPWFLPFIFKINCDYFFFYGTLYAVTLSQSWEFFTLSQKIFSLLLTFGMKQRLIMGEKEILLLVETLTWCLNGNTGNTHIYRSRIRHSLHFFLQCWAIYLKLLLLLLCSAVRKLMKVRLSLLSEDGQ